jgi:hypothetical protein
MSFAFMMLARLPKLDMSELDPKSIPGIYLGPEFHGPGYRILVYKLEYTRAHKYAVQVFRDSVCFENLTTVTGATKLTYRLALGWTCQLATTYHNP